MLRLALEYLAAVCGRLGHTVTLGAQAMPNAEGGLNRAHRMLLQWAVHAEPDKRQIEAFVHERMRLSDTHRPQGIALPSPPSPSPAPLGKLGFQLGRGGGVNSSTKTGGGGVRKRAQLTGPFISYYELWRQRCRKIF